MIRRSSAIALTALILSLVAHLLGLTFTARGAFEPRAPAPALEEASVGTAFEDIADATPEPFEPETAPEPEPEAAPPPEPDLAETPTSRALVASENPQNTPVPDTGTAPVPRPDSTGPITPEIGDTATPDVVDPSAGNASEIADALITPPVGADEVTELAQGTPDAPNPAEVAPVPEQFAALPAPVAPVSPISPNAPVAPSPNLPTVPLAPSEETEITPESELDQPSESTTTNAAPSTSLRPPSPQRRADARQQGVDDGSPDLRALRLRPTELIESPLTAYQRDGTDLFAGRRGGAQSSGTGSQNFSGPGNATITNYAGQVLVHLNNVRPVAASARGWARVFFVINPDGSLESVDIIDGSGSIEVDRAARAHVRSAAPFPIPPGGRIRRLNFVYQIR